MLFVMPTFMGTVFLFSAQKPLLKFCFWFHTVDYNHDDKPFSLWILNKVGVKGVRYKAMLKLNWTSFRNRWYINDCF